MGAYDKRCSICGKDMSTWDKMGLPCPYCTAIRDRKRAKQEATPQDNQKATERARHKAYVDAKFKEIWEYKGEPPDGEKCAFPDILGSFTDAYFAHLRENGLTQETSPKFEVEWSHSIGNAQNPYKKRRRV